MKKRPTLTNWLAGGAAIAAAASWWWGKRRQQRSLSALLEPLLHAPRLGASRADLSGLDDLPPPVAKYFRHVLAQGQPAIRLLRMKQAGTLRTDTNSNRWMPFEATHTVSPAATGFVWDASVRAFPLLHISVRDAYEAGTGSGMVLLAGALPVSSARGEAELNSGALHRYLAEAVWYPTALLPSEKLRWTAIDDSRALATLTDNGTTVSLEFRFNGAGEITGIYTPARWGMFGTGYRQQPWEGHFSHYVLAEGMRVPSEGEVGWYDSGQWRAVWKGRVLQLQYELAG